MKNIHLHLDEKFFYKLKQDKQRRETEFMKKITWENYIKLIFGFSLYIKPTGKLGIGK